MSKSVLVLFYIYINKPEAESPSVKIRVASSILFDSFNLAINYYFLAIFYYVFFAKRFISSLSFSVKFKLNLPATAFLHYESVYILGNYPIYI